MHRRTFFSRAVQSENVLDRVLEHEDSTRSMKLMHEYFNRVSYRHYDCADTEVEIHILHLFNVAHEFDAGEYAEAIEASKNIKN